MTLSHQLAEAAKADIILRPKGWEAQGDAGQAWLKKVMRSGHFYRGMTNDEYKATVGAGKPIKSTGRYSFSIEGTSFSHDPGDAESYANSGRDDPRKTGKPTWLVEVLKTKTMYRDRDGYTKDKEPVDTVTRVWRMYGKGGALVAKKVK